MLLRLRTIRAMIDFCFFNAFEPGLYIFNINHNTDVGADRIGRRSPGMKTIMRGKYHRQPKLRTIQFEGTSFAVVG